MGLLRHSRAHAGQGTVAVVAVIVVFAALVAVSIPAYLGFQDRREEKRAKTDLLAAAWTADAYRAKHGSYAGMDYVDLLKIDPRIPPTLTVTWARRTSYCLTDSQRGTTVSMAGPSRNGAKFSANADCA